MRISTAMAAAIVCTLPLSNAHSAGWTQSRQVTEFNQQPVAGSASELVFVTLTTGTNPSGCTTSNTFYFPVSTDREKRIFAMILSAHLAGKSVMLYTTGVCHANGSAQLDGANIT